MKFHKNLSSGSRVELHADGPGGVDSQTLFENLRKHLKWFIPFLVYLPNVYVSPRTNILHTAVVSSSLIWQR